MALGPSLILALKAAVTAATLVWLLSLAALWSGKPRLHGRINLAFFVLALSAILGLEMASRVIYPLIRPDEQDLFSYFDDATRRALRIHLCFAVPAALVLVGMLTTGLTGLRAVHVRLGVLFAMLWTGTVVTGLFFLPHTEPQPRSEIHASDPPFDHANPIHRGQQFQVAGRFSSRSCQVQLPDRSERGGQIDRPTIH